MKGKKQSNIEIKIVNASDVFGLTEARCIQLAQIVRNQFNTTENVPAAIAQVKKMASSLDEIYYVGFVIGRLIEQNESQGEALALVTKLLR